MSKKERLEDLLLAGDPLAVELVIEMLGYYRGMHTHPTPGWATDVGLKEHNDLETRYEKLVQPELFCAECGRKYEPGKTD